MDVPPLACLIHSASYASLDTIETEIKNGVHLFSQSNAFIVTLHVLHHALNRVPSMDCRTFCFKICVYVNGVHLLSQSNAFIVIVHVLHGTLSHREPALWTLCL